MSTNQTNKHQAPNPLQRAQTPQTPNPLQTAQALQKTPNPLQVAQAPQTPNPLQNHLLAALPLPNQTPFIDKLELVTLPLGKVLYESGDDELYVYFPTNCIVSLLYVMEDGASAEIAVVGNEGMVGISVFMGGEVPSVFRLPKG